MADKRKKNEKPEPENAEIKVTTHVDAEGVFRRTALVIEAATGSVDVLDRHGKLLVRMNISHSTQSDTYEEWFNVDVIDIDKRFARRRCLGAFGANFRSVECEDTLACTEFSTPKKED